MQVTLFRFIFVNSTESHVPFNFIVQLDMCVGLLHKIQLKYIEVYYFCMTK